METLTLERTLRSPRPAEAGLLGLLLICVVYFIGVHPLFAGGGRSLAHWCWEACNNKNGNLHGRFVPFLFLFFLQMSWKTIKSEAVKPSMWGLVGVVLFFALYLLAVRTKQPRVLLFGLPFLIVGVSQFLFGWKVAKHILFPAFFWYFAIPVPGIEQATTVLQVWVTKMCYYTGLLFGMEIANEGNNIFSTSSDGWTVDIAEGCSGIRSLMALTMIAAIYAYYSQKQLWKKALLFSMALPLAMLGNYGRIVTILFLNEAGLEKFATGAYHNWAGLLIFFPIALVGLFLLDRLLNPRKRRLKKTLKVENTSS